MVRTTILRYLILACACVCVVFPLSSFGHPITVHNVSKYIVSKYIGEDRWEWTVFIEAPPHLMEMIECVEYRLHRSFRNPVVRQCETRDPRFPFGYTARGWGTFEIGVRVELKNGEVIPLWHMLTFEPPKRSGELHIETRNIATQIGPNSWRWTAFIEAPREVLEAIECVEYTLHPTFPEPVRVVCQMGSPSQAFPITAIGWGTFELEVRVFFKDGSVRHLIHPLRF